MHIDSSRIITVFIGFLLAVCVVCDSDCCVYRCIRSSTYPAQEKNFLAVSHLILHCVSQYLTCPVLPSLFYTGILHASGIPMEMWRWLHEDPNIINKWDNTGTVSSPRHGLYTGSSLRRLLLFNTEGFVSLNRTQWWLCKPWVYLQLSLLQAKQKWM